ncbi:hypothetical protein RvY_04393 [Ramazzottius varieornatus]|uniref:Major facilitator superfamily (MFS) profile domain-containing protein n=1 Tax=Ramazzottius varieornatus TaxID=947166 RepID=A0A1D1V0R1_RAMVA|nr:hypothetical protein RvY_04393 [Ramazzottius varieornatus]
MREVKCRRSNQTVETEHGVSEEKWCKKLDFTGELNMFTDNSELTTFWTLTVSSLVASSFFGAISANIFADRIGRRGALWGNGVVGVIGAVVMGCAFFADSIEMLVLGRLIAGFTVGISSSLPPVYLNEIAPTSLRGAVGALHELSLVTGIFVAQILGLPYILGNAWGWPLLLGASGIPVLFMLVALPFCPESPRYLFVKKQDEQATRRALNRLRGTSDVEAELDEIGQEYALTLRAPKFSIGDLFKDPFLRKTTFIAIGVMVCQHFSGVIAVMFYSTAIFKSAGLTQSNQAIYATIALGGINVLATVVTVFLMEKVGRKVLLLIGFTGMAVLMTILTICLFQTKVTHPLVEDNALAIGINPFAIGSTLSLLGYIIFFSIGPGAIPWVLVTELFATAPRAAASSVAVGVNRLSAFLIALAFPYIQAAIEEYTFVIFIATLTLAMVFTNTCIIETKGKTVEAIQYELRHGPLMTRHSRRSAIKPRVRDVTYDQVEMEEKTIVKEIT